jgi:cysteine desulfurase / selenocysteine lyase
LAKVAEAVEAAIAGEGKLDPRKLRADFPIFEQRFHGKPLAYLDSAVSAQKPRQVLDAQREFYETSYTNVHRGVYLLAERAPSASRVRARRCEASSPPPRARSSSRAARPRR